MNEEIRMEFGISHEEALEIDNYIQIYRENDLNEHYEVNMYISRNNLWGNFVNIRSLNDHGESKNIPGILPKFYAAVCKELNIGGAGGDPLDNARSY